MFKCCCKSASYNVQRGSSGRSKRSTDNLPKDIPKKQNDSLPPPVLEIPPPPPVEEEEEVEKVENVSEASYVEDDSSVRRRSGLAGHAAKVDKKNLDKIEIKKVVKDQNAEKLIREAIAKNDFLPSLLEGKRLQEVIDAMYLIEVRAGEVIIKEDGVGTQLYISFSGTYEVSIKDKIISTFSANCVFGELAILYDAKRQATIKALTDGSLWVLDQNVYQKLTLSNEIEHRERMVNFLRSVPNLNTVKDEVLLGVSDLLKREFFKTDCIIVKQGDEGDKFYIISAGVVSISKIGEGKVGKMIRGEYFGHLALLGNDVRQATVTAEAPGVECFSLSRQEFINHFGNIKDINSISTKREESKFEPVANDYQDVELTNLKKIGILGIGGFGRVDLLQHNKKPEITFALKCLKKIDMIEQQQQEHTYNERNIQITCNSVFIARLYKTFRDNKYIYFLMEPCLGGDLWLLLQKQRNRRFEEDVARFYAASVLEALAYLHQRNFVYRDLKPENLLLDTKGYLKLTDFGFAKPLGAQGKTYTFAGTPEYVAPEVILTRGHDRSVDYWALGILIYELLVGRTPFRTSDASHMKTYNLILRGIDKIRFPEIVSIKAEKLIKKLCKSMPTERLGCQRQGPQAIRDHKWFEKFEWKQLQSCKMKAPHARRIRHNTDMQYFEKFEKDTDIPPDELSGWDEGF